MSSSDQLSKWASEHIDGFAGVYCSDQLAEARAALARVRARTRCVIFNYDPSTKPGSHWCGFRITPDAAEWCDSFGLEPDADDGILRDKTHFRSFCEEHAVRGRFVYNQLDLQSLEGTSCGQYSLWFCLNGLPDPAVPAWLPVFEAGGQPPIAMKVRGGIPGLRRIDQAAAARRDEKIKELVRLG